MRWRGFLVTSMTATALAAAVPAPPRARDVTYDEVRAIVAALGSSAPAEIVSVPEQARAAAWPRWVTGRRTATLARLQRGEEDSAVSLLLFGTSFTGQPRLTAAFLEGLDREWRTGDRERAEGTLTAAYRQRASDLVAAAMTPGTNERLRLVRSVLERAGCALDSRAGRQKAQDYLLASVQRVRQESAAIARSLEAARQLPDSTRAFAERSRLFRERGLAPDSSVLTQYAVDRALLALKERGQLMPGSVRRGLVVGPGLDLVDKQDGPDFYPPQSLQPLALMDSLYRHGLARPGRLEMVTIDVNPRVASHLRDARTRADRNGPGYRLVLPRCAAAGWTPDTIDYWSRLGSEIGTPFTTGAPASLPGFVVRGIAVRNGELGRLTALEANIVFDRFAVAPDERFDLALATNVFVYYDTFEQTLALAGVAGLLRAGGLLLSNNALLEIPEVPMKSSGYLTVRFSDREDDGEHVVFYERVR